jgi:hypothetical protein
MPDRDTFIVAATWQTAKADILIFNLDEPASATSERLFAFRRAPLTVVVPLIVAATF